MAVPDWVDQLGLFPIAVFGWGDVFETAVNTELALAAALICAPKGVGVFAHDCEGHAIMEWAAGEAFVGDKYVPACSTF
jgi:hypothetical protein